MKTKFNSTWGTFFACAVSTVFLCGGCQDRPTKPNIIFIMADDMGYSDLGSQGSLIETPNLDYLIHNGTYFPNFYNAGTCSPSRAALMTGQYPHKVGCGSNGKDYNTKAFRGHLSTTVSTLPELLKTFGYKTYLSGKWQLGWTESQRPTSRGFDQAFQMGQGGVGGTYFHPFVNRTQARPLLNNQPIDFDREAFYTTDAFTDHAIKFIEQHTADSQKDPFFLYLSYNAPHFPLQAKQKDIQKYLDSYKDGYPALLKNKTQIPNPQVLTQLETAWTNLSAEEQKIETQKMAVYAAQVDCMDQNIGKLLARLRELELEDDTYILFVSDNGANHNSLGSKDNGSSNTIGDHRSWTSYGHAWATVSNYPYRYFKSYTHEGGIKSPFVLYKANLENKTILEPVHIIDILPSLLQLSAYDDITSSEIDGKSFTNLLDSVSPQNNPKNRTLYWESLGHRAVRQGPWKAVSMGDLPNTPWELYNLESDPFELIDRALSQPHLLDSLTNMYAIWSDSLGILTIAERQLITTQTNK